MCNIEACAQQQQNEFFLNNVGLQIEKNTTNCHKHPARIQRGESEGHTEGLGARVLREGCASRSRGHMGQNTGEGHADEYGRRHITAQITPQHTPFLSAPPPRVCLWYTSIAAAELLQGGSNGARCASFPNSGSLA